MSQEQSAEIQFALMRYGKERQVIPWYTDKAKVTASSASGQPDVLCVPRHRRFAEDARVLIHNWTQDCVPTDVEIHELEFIKPDRLTLKTNLANTFLPGARIYPLLDVELALQNRLSLFVPNCADTVFTLFEVAAESAYPPFSFKNDFASGSKYLGIDILDTELDWSTLPDVSFVRQGTVESVGRGRVIHVDGERPRLEFSQAFTFLSRKAWWDFFMFLDSRRGRAYPFFYVPPQDLFELVAITTSQLQIKAWKNIEDFTCFVPFVSIKLRDGSKVIRGYSSIVPSGDDWIITFDAVIPAKFTVTANIRKTTSAHLVRNQADLIREDWLTDEVVFMRATFQELPRDVVATIDTELVLPPIMRETKVIVEVLGAA